MDLVNHEFGVGGDVRVLGEDFVDSQHSRIRNGGSIGPIEVKGDVRRRDGVLNENAVEDTVSWRIVDLIRDFRPRVWAQTNKSGEALSLDIYGEGGCVVYEHCIEVVRNFNETERGVYRTICLVLDSIATKLESCCLDVATSLSDSVVECLLGAQRCCLRDVSGNPEVAAACMRPQRLKSTVYTVSDLPVSSKTGTDLVPRVMVLMYSALKVFLTGIVEFSALPDKARGWALRTWNGTLPACAK